MRTANRYEDQFAARAARLRGSDVRAMFAALSSPGMISFGGGNPAVDLLDQRAIVEATARAVARSDAALSYGSGAGLPDLRERLCEVMALEGLTVAPEDIVVTTGSQNGIDLIAKLFLDPGDIVLAEGPCYLSTLLVCESYEAEVRHVQIDSDGMIPERLESAITQASREGRNAKLLYLVPSFQNPTGVVLSPRRRAEILRVADRYGLVVVEDSPYALLSFGAPAPRPMKALDPDGVIYLGTLSKTLAPGFRIGWVVAPPEVRSRLLLANEAAVLSPATFTQAVAAEWFATVDWRAQLDVFRDAYRERKDAMTSELALELPEATWTDPDGGLFLWLRCPGLDAKASLPDAVAAGVAYTPGTAFFADRRGADCLRLCFSYPSPDCVREGVRRLALALVQDRATEPAGPTRSGPPGGAWQAASSAARRPDWPRTRLSRHRAAS